MSRAGNLLGISSNQISLNMMGSENKERQILISHFSILTDDNSQFLYEYKTKSLDFTSA